MAKMVIVKCKNCRNPFQAREADRKRGWGRFCSKSCKARKQARTTGYAGPRYHEQQDRYRTAADLPEDEAGTCGHHIWK